MQAVESERVMRPATLLGRSIFDGIAEGIDDSANQMLHGAYDDDESFDVDPLCQLGGDRFELIDKIGEDLHVPGRVPSAEPLKSDSESTSE